MITDRSTYVEIDLDAFRWNFNQIKKTVKPAQIAAVVKANAYGHGVEVIAKESVRLGAKYLCVAFVNEGLEIRQMGITIPILVFAPPVSNEIKPALKNDLELIVCSSDEAREIAAVAKELGKTASIQINIDTGIHRTGLLWKNALEELKKINTVTGITISGIYTHFATSEWTDLTFAYEQLDRFKTILKNIPFSPPLIHAANSGAILQIKESYFKMVRPGISLYGYYPSLFCKRRFSLKPVMTFKSFVAHVREYEADERFSYSLTYCTEKQTCIATVPAGYADGINRLLSNTGKVLINGKKYPIAGMVSMDCILVDVGPNSNVREGDEAVLFGKQGNSEISGYDWCDILHNIPNELVCAITSRVPRKYINERKK